MSINQAKSSTYCTQFCFNYFQSTPALYVNSQVSVPLSGSYYRQCKSTSIVVPTECDVLIVGNIMTIIVHFTIEHQVHYGWKFKEQHAKCGKILPGRKDTLAPVVSTLRGQAPPSPPLFRRLCSKLSTARGPCLCNIS